MISLLPVTGGFITLSKRCLSPAVVYKSPLMVTGKLMCRVSYVGGHIGLHMQSERQSKFSQHKISSDIGIQTTLTSLFRLEWHVLVFFLLQ